MIEFDQCMFSVQKILNCDFFVEEEYLNNIKQLEFQVEQGYQGVVKINDKIKIYYLLKYYLWLPIVLGQINTVEEFYSVLKYFDLYKRRFSLTTLKKDFEPLCESVSSFLKNYKAKKKIETENALHKLSTSLNKVITILNSIKKYNKKHNEGHFYIQSNPNPTEILKDMDYYLQKEDKRDYVNLRRMLGDSKYESLSRLPWTHSSSIYGLRGILGSGIFWSTVEDNINFRYDLDSRYWGGVTFIMNPKLDLFAEGGYIQDLYNQAHHLDSHWADKKTQLPLKDQSKRKLAKSHLFLLYLISNYRDEQLSCYNKIKKPGTEFNFVGKKPPSHLQYNSDANSILSLVNPQLRISRTNPVPWNLIDGIIVLKEIHDQMMNDLLNPVRLNEIKEGTLKFYSQNKNKDWEKYIDSTNIISNLKSRYDAYVKSGRVKIVDLPMKDAMVFWNRSTAGNTAVRESRLNKEGVRNAIEYGDKFSKGKTGSTYTGNNSPSSMKFSTFLKVQEQYYNFLSEKNRDDVLSTYIPLMAEKNKMRELFPKSEWDSSENMNAKDREIGINTAVIQSNLRTITEEID